MAQDQSAELQAIVARDAELQRLFAEYRARPGLETTGKITARMKALFGPEGMPVDYKLDPKTGQVARENAFTRNADWILPAAAGAVAAPFAAGAAGGAAGGGGAAAASAAAPAAAAASPFATLFSPSVLPYVIGAGTSIAGNVIASRGNTEAARIQAESADKALALQKELYDTQRADLAPYRELGLGAIGQLRHGMGYGVNPASQGEQPEGWEAPVGIGNPINRGTTASTDPGVGNLSRGQEMPMSGPTQGLAGLGSTPTAPGGLVTVMAPDGETRALEPEMAERAIQAGGRRL